MLWACHRAVSIRPHLSTSTTYACVKGVRPRSGLASRDVASVLDSPLNSDPQPREIQVTGHVRTVRHQKQRAFASIGDGTTTRSLQVLLDPLQATGWVPMTMKISWFWHFSDTRRGLQARNRYGSDHLRKVAAVSSRKGAVTRVTRAQGGGVREGGLKRNYWLIPPS